MMSPLDWGVEHAGWGQMTEAPRNEWQQKRLQELWMDPSLSHDQRVFEESIVTAKPGTWLNPGKVDHGGFGDPQRRLGSAEGWSALRRGF